MIVKSTNFLGYFILFFEKKIKIVEFCRFFCIFAKNNARCYNNPIQS